MYVVISRRKKMINEFCKLYFIDHGNRIDPFYECSITPFCCVLFSCAFRRSGWESGALRAIDCETCSTVDGASCLGLLVIGAVFLPNWFIE